MGFCRILGFALTGLLLNGCGGGGGSAGNNGADGASGGAPVAVGTPNAALVLTVVGAVANQVTSLSASSPATLSVTFTDPSGAPVADAIISFTPNMPILVKFSPSSGSNTTDKSGRTSIQVIPGNTISTGPVSINASVTYNGSSVTSNTVQLNVTQG